MGDTSGGQDASRGGGGSDPIVRVTVDPEACMGSGNCVFWAPGVFELDEDGVARVCGDPRGHEDQVRFAAEHCPTRAIAIDDGPA